MAAILESKMSAEAIELLRKAKDGLFFKGDARAQCNLGAMFRDGVGVAKDNVQAVEWLRKAAEQGHADAQFGFGVMLYEGQGVAKDERQAVEWFRKAAKKGNAHAQYKLGCILIREVPIERQSDVVEWYREAAEQGYAQAQYKLGWMLEYGYGEDRQQTMDQQQAVEWYRKAAEQGYAEAQCNLGNMLRNGQGVTKNEQQAKEWFRKAAEQGHAQAQYYLGWMLAEVQGVAKDEQQGMEWYFKAAAQGLASAQHALGQMFRRGRGVAKDERQAVEWYRKAAKQKHAQAQYKLGWMLENGLGVTKDEREAVAWYRYAAYSGHAQAQYKLGWMLEYGYGEDRQQTMNQQQGMEWYFKAAEQGYAQAQYKLGWMLENGRVFAKDEQAAVRYYRRAAEQRHGDAERALKRLQSVNPSFSSVLSSSLLVNPAEVAAVELKEKTETKLTQKQLEVIEVLGRGLTARDVEHFKKDLHLFSAQECQVSLDWIKNVNSHLSALLHGLSEAHRELGLDPQTKAKCEFIKTHPKLLAYQRRLEMEFGYFALVYCLAPSGLQLEGNKKDVVISAMSFIPKATIENIPLVGPLVAKVFGLIPMALRFANKRHRMRQANQVKELFGGLREIIKIAYLLSLESTLAKQSEIEAHEKMEYEGFARIKGLYELGKKVVMQQWNDLITSNTTGIRLQPTEELAILDCAFIMQQVSAKEVHIDSDRELVPQLVELVTGKPYEPIVLPVTSTAVSTQIVAPATSVTHRNFPSFAPHNPATVSEVEGLKEELKAHRETARQQEERQRRLEEALEAERAERRTLAEKLSKVQKQLQPIEIGGGAEALVFERAEMSSTPSITISYAEFHALRQQVTHVTQTAEQAIERVDGMSMVVYALQDGKKTDRGKVGAKHITYARDLDTREADRKRQEEVASTAKRTQMKRVVTTTDLM